MTDGELKEKLAMPLAELELNVRITNMLEEIQVYTVGDVLGSTRETLQALPGFGPKALAQVFAGLATIGFYPHEPARRG